MSGGPAAMPAHGGPRDRERTDDRWRVGGIAVHLRSLDPALRLANTTGRSLFVDSGPSADAIVTATRGDLGTATSARPDFSSGGVWTAHRAGAHHELHFRSPAFGSTPYKRARFAADFSSGEVVLHRAYFDAARPVDPLEYPLDELLVNALLAHRDGVTLHACGVADRGEGLVFVGASGAGKSTIASLWAMHDGVTILSDDRVVVRLSGDRAWLYGTPWHGEAGSVAPGPVPLARIFLLEQAAECRTRSIGGARVVAQLFAGSFPPFFWAEGLGATLGTLERLAQRVPCAVLGFPADPSIIEYVRRGRAAAPGRTA